MDGRKALDIDVSSSVHVDSSDISMYSTAFLDNHFFQGVTEII